MCSSKTARLIVWGICILSVQIGIPQVCAQEPVLERYVLSYGGTTGGTSEGITAVLHDRYFGGGTAQSTISFAVREQSSVIDMRVWRKVRRGTIVFALLVFRVEIRGFNGDGEIVFSRDLEGFTFGDSSSGYWSARHQDLPAELEQIQVAFVGNYE